MRAPGSLMQKTLLLSGLLLSALVAGCTDDGTDTDDLTVPPMEAPLALHLNECSEQIAILPIPWDAAAAMLPEGFAPVPFDATTEGVLATEVVLAYGCANQTGAVEAAEPTYEMTGGIFVVPPEHLLAENVTYYAWTYGFFTTNEQNAALYDSWNLSTSSVADVMVGSLADTPAAGVGHAVGSADGFTVHLYTTVHGEAGTEKAGTVRMFGFDEETMEVTNAVDFSWSDSTSMRSGEGFVRGDPPLDFLPPVAPGVAFQIAGDYGYSFTYVAIDAAGTPAGDAMQTGVQFRAL